MNKPYHDKYGFKGRQIEEIPDSDLGISVCIPVHNEEALIKSLQSLADCIPPKCAVDVLCMINAGVSASEEIKQRNLQTGEEVLTWQKKSNPFFRLYVLFDNEFPDKHAGVGLARKIAMDEACLRFGDLNKDGILVCFDADSLCEKNYFIEIEKHFELNPNTPGCSIHYEHPIEGSEFDEGVYKAITEYELHLRYYNLALGMTEFPGSFHTIGSSMAVRRFAYEKQGGMNKRKAGEDFYFLHKIIQLGNFTELTTTKVIPSPRVSDRVPFGTGKAVGDYMEEGTSELFTYNLNSFKDLQKTFEIILKSYPEKVVFDHLPEAIQNFMGKDDFEGKMAEIFRQTTHLESFKKRFFVWFDAFRILKFVHYARDQFYPNVPVSEAVILLAKELNIEIDTSDNKSLLLVLRNYEAKKKPLNE